MTTYQILSLLGVGSVLSAVIIYLLTWPRKMAKRIKALCLGVQAMLRAQMWDMYTYYKAIGHAPLHAKENFENLWINYEQLGLNGVFKNLHDEFMSWPNDPPKEEKSK